MEWILLLVVGGVAFHLAGKGGGRKRSRRRRNHVTRALRYAFQTIMDLVKLGVMLVCSGVALGVVLTVVVSHI